MPIGRPSQLNALALALLIFGGAASSWAQAPQVDNPPAPAAEQPKGSAKEPVRLEPTVTTATRTERALEDVPVPVFVVTPREVEAAPAKTVDDLIRNIPGTNLSRGQTTVTHPTGQSVGLRGIGSTRALVLVDGVPLNDAFGGWVNWSKVALPNIEQIEVVKGGGSSLWGTYAMGGVINILTRVPDHRVAILEGGYGTQDTWRLNLYGAEVFDHGAVSLNLAKLDTDGYEVIPERIRGAVDRNAFSESQSANLKLDYRLVPSVRLSASFTGFDQEANVGTPLTNNARESVDGSAVLGVDLDELGDLKFSLFTGWQEFRNSNSRIGANRNSETIALRQYLPSADLGGSVQWSRRVSDFWDLVMLGLDARRIWGSNQEKLYGTTAATAGRFLRRRDTEGTQLAGGLFGEVIVKPVPAWLVSLNARGDYWTSYDGERIEGGLAPIEFEDQTRTALSGKLATRYRVDELVALRTALYKAIRFPTLNELYRGFFSGNIAFEGNTALGPEEVWGAEAGVDLSALNKRVMVKLTPFYNLVKNLITSVTKSPTLRQRENAGNSVSQGVELETSYQIVRELALIADYVFTDSRWIDFRHDRSLKGGRVPNVPEHQVSTALQYANPAIATVTVRGRFVSDAYADDRHQDKLDAYFVLDVSASREIYKGIELFVIAENVTDEAYFASRSGAVGTLGAPFQFFGGLRAKF
jgi:outer membrane receptor protein involved in Fe transport